MKTQRGAKLRLIFAMAMFGTLGLFIRAIPLPSSVIALVRGTVGAGFLLALLKQVQIVLAAAGISGIPGLSGYISKSLLHEGLVEYIHELAHHGANALPYEIAEWVFIISGGMTLCYMTKLYICLFWQKHPTRQAEFDGMKKYMSAPSAIALALCACVIPVLGLMPHTFMTRIGQLAQHFHPLFRSSRTTAACHQTIGICYRGTSILQGIP